MAQTNNLKAWREEAGWTQLELAERLGTTHVSIWRIESKGQRPRQDLMTAILHLFGYSSEADFYDVESSGIAGVPGVRKVQVVPPLLVNAWLDGAEDVDFGSEYEVTTRPYSDRVFAFRNFGDAMLPTYADGDIVFIDPDIMPSPNQCALFATERKAEFRQYKERGPNQDGEDYFEAVTIRDGYAAMRSDRHPMRIAGVEVERRSFQVLHPVGELDGVALLSSERQHQVNPVARRSARTGRQRTRTVIAGMIERNCILCAV